MSTFHGLPAHILLNHFIIVLIPLTAILAIVCVLWPAARRRLVWLVLALSVATVIVTPLTTSAGQWLFERADIQSAVLNTHTERGNTTIYFSVALLLAAVLIAVLHVYQGRGRMVKPVAQWLVGALVIVTAVVVTYQVYRIGESGARAAWGDFMSSIAP